MADPPGGPAFTPEQQTWLNKLPDVKLQMPTLQVGPQIAPPKLGGDLQLSLPGAPPSGTPPAPASAAPRPALIPPLVPPGPAAAPSPFALPMPPSAPAAAGGGSDGLRLNLGKGVALTAGTDVPGPLPGISPPPPDDPSLKAALEFKRGPVTVSGEGSRDTGGGTQIMGGVKVEF